MADEAFTPPPLSSHEGPAAGFTPPPLSSHEGPAESKPSPLERFAKGVYQYSPLGAVGGTVEAMGKHPWETAIGGPLLPLLHEGVEGIVRGVRGAFDSSKPVSERVESGVSAIPTAGPVAADLMRKGREQDVAGLAGAATGIVTTAAAPKVLGKAGELFSERGDPHLQVVQALKPASGKTGFLENLQTSMPEIKATGMEINGIDDLLGTPEKPGAIQAAKQANRAQYQKILGPQQAMHTTVDLTPIAEARIKAIPQKMWLEQPAAARRMALEAGRYRGRFPIEQADAFLRETNAQLEAYYSKNPAARRTSATANADTASLVSEANALRTQIYKTLDDPGQGAAARELQRRYGTLMELEKTAYQRRNVAMRQQPESLSEQLGKWSAAGQAAKGTVRLLTGDVSGAADIAGALAKRKAASWLKEQQTTDALIRRAFKDYNRTPAPITMPPPFKPAGLLDRGAIRTEPPADTSYVRGRESAPHEMHGRLGLPPGRAPFTQGTVVPDILGRPGQTTGHLLEAPQPGQPPVNVQTPGPASTRVPPIVPQSQARPIPQGPMGGGEDLVPVTHPRTGQQVFVPRWWLELQR